MKTVLLDVYNEKVEVIDIDDELDAFYEKLDCNCIDIVTRRIDGMEFDIMCDDEGLFHDPRKLSAINDMGEPMLVGTLMFFHHDDEGDLVGLTDEAVEFIQDHIQTMYTGLYPQGYPMLTQCA